MAENKNWEKVQLKNAIQNLNRILSNKQQNQLKKYLCNQQRLVRITFCSGNAKPKIDCYQPQPGFIRNV